MESKIRTGVLRSDIKYIRPGVHGTYPMLYDPLAEQYYKLTPEAGLVISKLDRDYALDEFLSKLTRLGIEATKEEVLTVLNFLAGTSLLAPETGRYEQQLFQHRKAVQSVSWLMKLASVYMYFRLPPLHPRKFLNWIAPYVHFLTDRWFLWCLIIPSLLGYINCLREFSAIREAFINSLSWAGLVKYFFAIVLLKVVHESAHALAATRFGCPVRAIGVSFIFFYPRIFSDTTDSWILPRRKRLLIDAGGLLGEILIGGIAALIWSALPPGAEKSTMFYIFAVSTLSTILVNGNPFIRFDGYYILCDILNTENLMQRSSEYVRNLWRSYLFRLMPPPQEERPFLMLIFGISAFIYRFFLYTSIILVIYNNFIHIKILAAVMLFMEVYTLVIFPLVRETQAVRLMSRRAAGKANYWAALIILFAVCGILFLPLSRSLHLPGEVKSQIVRVVSVPESGFLHTQWPESSYPVSRGTSLAELKSELFDLGVRRLDAQIAEDKILIDLQQSDKESFGDSLLTLQKLSSDREARSELLRRRALRNITAEIDGVFVPGIRRLSPGVWLGAGTILGEITAGEPRIHAFANDREVLYIQAGDKVSILLPDAPLAIAGTVETVEPIPAKLNNSPLLQLYGGEIPVYIDEKNPGAFLSVQSMYRISIVPDKGAKGLFYGRSLRIFVSRKEALISDLWKMVVTAFRREL